MKKKILVLLLTITALLTACQTQFPGLSVPAGIGTPVPPALLSVTATATDSLRVMFSTNVLKSSAEDLSHYSVTSSNLTILSASLDLTNGALLWLTTSKMSAASNYTLQCSGVEGENGLASAADSLSFNGFGADDSTPPSIIITEPVDNQLIAKSFLVYGTASDDTGIDHVEIRVDGGTYVMATNTVNWSYQLDTTVYNESYSHVIYAKAVDLKGNSKVATVTVNIDRTPPTLTANPPSGVKVINPGDTITITGTAGDNVQFSMVGAYLTNLGNTNAYGGTWINGSNWQIVITNTGYLDESTNRLMVFAQDTAGNMTTTNTEYVLYRNAFYVRTNGEPTGDGTWWHPRDTINGAKSLGFGISTILVAGGMYSDSLSGNWDGKIVKGGFNQDFSMQNIGDYKSIVSKPVLAYNLHIENMKLMNGCTNNNTYTGNIFISNYIVGDYISTNPMPGWIGNAYRNVFVGNIISNSRVQLTFGFLDGWGNYFSNNIIYGEVDDISGASVAPDTAVGDYISNVFIGIENLTNCALKITPKDMEINGLASGPMTYTIQGNIFSNYFIGVNINDDGALAHLIYIDQNKFYTTGYGIYEALSTSEPESVISNAFHLLNGSYYFDPQRTPNAVSSIADLNALDENGYNLAGTVYSNVNF